MNADIENFLNSYNSSIDIYKDKVAADDAKLQEVLNYLNEMKTLGESCSDIGQFMTKVTDKDMMNVMTTKITELAEHALALDRASGNMKIPAAKDLAFGYHQAYDAIDNKEECPLTCEVYRRVFELENESEYAPELLKKLAQENLLVKMASVHLAEVSRKANKETEALSQPLMIYHNEEVAKMAESASTAIEMEYETQRLVELNRIEMMNDQMLCADLYYRVGSAVSSYLFNDSEENRQRVVANYRFINEFFSIDKDELFEIPRIRDLIEKVIIPPLNDKGQLYTLESYIEEQKKVITGCMEKEEPAAKGPESRKTAMLWGNTYELNDMLNQYKNPQRPEEFKS